MFPRSRSIDFAEPPPWRGTLEVGAGRERHLAGAAQHFRNAVAALATLSTFGGVLFYLIVG